MFCGCLCTGLSSMENKSVFSLQNFIKEEPVSNGTPRLHTFRPPRDLSLGGTKPKKVYTPNLNVTRPKNKPKEQIIRKETKRNVRNHDSKHTKSNLSQRYVQTQGVFSEGSGEIRPSMGLSENLSSSRQQETLRAPKIRKTSLIVKDTKIEDAVAEDLLRDSGSEEELEDIYDPLVLDGEVFTKKLDCKKEEIVTERFEDMKNETKMIDFKQEEFFKSEQYSDSNMCFSLLQFPDSFAGRGGSGDKSETNLDFKLSNVGEGKIGTIVIRRSGKMQLQVGKNFYDFAATGSADFTQDIVARADDEHGRKKMGKIGSIKGQYVITPDWNRFF